MKVLKPQKLGVLHRMFEAGDRYYFVVTAFVFFPLDAPRAVLSEQSMWPFVGEALGESAILDEGYSKVRGEVLVHGSCYQAGGVARPTSYVRVTMGAIDKKLAVIGDRFWKHGVPTDPAPFTEMPLDWAHAFGGEGYPSNPLGKGHAPIMTEATKTSKAEQVHPLPNVEHHDRLIRSPKDHPLPAGFGAYDLMWPQRFAKVGTYDEEWLRTRFPGVAKDLDPLFFNVCPEDQWHKRYFGLDEAFQVENMHPTQPRVAGHLPGLRVRAFITDRGDETRALREMQTRIDTVHLFPGALRGVACYRGMLEVSEDDAADVAHLIVAAEDPSAPRSIEHYQRVLAERLDKRKGALASIRDSDLMPSTGGYVATADKSDVETMITGKGALRRNLKNKEQQGREDARARLLAQGLDPADLGMDDWPVDEEIPSIDDSDAFFAYIDEKNASAEKSKLELEAKKVESEKHAREQFAAMGVDYDKASADALKEAAGPPKFSAEAEVERLRNMLTIAREGGQPLEEMEAQVAHPGYLASMQAMELQLTDAYRKFAHYYPAAGSLDPAQSQELRVIAMAARDGDVSMAGRDFTGADLSGLDLSGLDLTGAFLEGADLSGADLGGANLTDAVLARVKLNGANLKGANLTGANLGEATLHGADFTGAALERAVLAKTNLDGACLREATLTGTTLLETTLGNVDLRGAVGHELILLQTDITKAQLAGADLSRTRFIEVSLAGVDFTGANLSGAHFMKCNADGAVFRNAKLDGAVFVYESSLVGADFTGASMPSVNLRGTPLRGAKFNGATLDGADFGGCDLSGADLYRAVAKNALFINAKLREASMVAMNLMSALLAKADLRGADLTGSNLFRADLARILTDGKTKLDDCLMTQARVVVRKSHAAE